MQPQIIGISGSPIKNSNTDRLIHAVLESSGLSSEVTPEKFCNVEDQTETWEQAKALGQEIARKLSDLMRM
jgi:shikimate 5-dehydrogenase